MQKVRVLIVFFGIIFLSAFPIYKTLMFNLKPDSRLIAKAKYQFTSTIELTPKRGDIFDRNANTIAISRSVNSLFAEPNKISDKEKLAKELSILLDIDYKNTFNRINNNKSFVWIKRMLSDEESKKLTTLIKNNNSIHFKQENKRVYPYETIAAHVLGYVNIDAKGVSGVESVYNNFLLNENKLIKYQRDAKGRALESNSHYLISESNNKIYLTIDTSLQYHVEQELKFAVENWSAKGGTVIVMDPNTGEILALANYPTYNPNDTSNYDAYVWKNRAITDVFEPGSTFKIFTVGVALKNKVVDKEELIDGEGGRFLVGQGRSSKIIKEAQNKDYGMMSLDKLIAKSSNVGSAKLGLRLGYDNLLEGIKLFGFSQKTDLDLVGEVRGILREKGGPVDLANLSFGQGLGVTPMQLVKAYSIIANGGYDIKPYVLDKIEDGEGNLIYKQENIKNYQLISKELSYELRRMLRLVVEEGTGVGTEIDGFQVAGKTGTAEKFIDGAYSKDKYIASFVGFFPADEPKYTMLTLIDEPKSAHFASIVAVPLFRKIANHIIQRKNISPSNINLVNLDNKIIQNNSKKELNNFKEELKKNFDEEILPSVEGLTLKEVLSKINAKLDDIEVIGSGRIVKQYPLPGTKNEDIKKITLWLE